MTGLLPCRPAGSAQADAAQMLGKAVCASKHTTGAPLRPQRSDFPESEGPGSRLWSMCMSMRLPLRSPGRGLFVSSRSRHVVLALIGARDLRPVEPRRVPGDRGLVAPVGDAVTHRRRRHVSRLQTSTVPPAISPSPSRERGLARRRRAPRARRARAAGSGETRGSRSTRGRVRHRGPGPQGPSRRRTSRRRRRNRHARPWPSRSRGPREML